MRGYPYDDVNPDDHIEEITRRIASDPLGNRFFLVDERVGVSEFHRTDSSIPEMAELNQQTMRDQVDRALVKSAVEIALFGAKTPEEKAEIYAMFGPAASVYFESDPGGFGTRGSNYNNLGKAPDKDANMSPRLALDAFSTNTEIPTASTNHDRPRTIAAVYDPDDQVMTLTFRDGTMYNYMGVTQDEWKMFRSSPSKGRLLKKGSKFDLKQRGPADMSRISEPARELVYKAYRVAQMRFEGNLMPKPYSRASKAPAKLQGNNLKHYKARQKRGRK